MKRILDYDPYTRTTTWHDYDHATGKTYIGETQDVRPFLEVSQKLANNSDYKRGGIKNDWMHFATVPNAIILKLLQDYNLDIYNKDDMPKIEKVLQRDFKKCMTVNRI